MIHIARTTEDEQAACLALLPEVWNVPVELIAARRDGVLIGAAGLLWESWADPAGFPIAVHVIPEARRQGVGRALVDTALALVDGESDGLWTLGNVAEESEAADFLRGCGFAPQKRITHFEMQGQSFHDHVERIVARLRRNGHIPADARTVALRDAPLDDVARLVAGEFSGGPARLLSRMRRGLAVGDGSGIDFDRSTVVMEGAQVAGALLYHWNDGDPVIEANVVAPAWRNSYVNALQLQVATKHGLDGGATSFRFDSDETVRDSMNLARRGGARPIKTEARFYRAMAS